MQAEDLLVEIRNARWQRIGQIRPDDLDMTFTFRDMAPGEWTIRLPSGHAAATQLAEPGAGIVLRHVPSGWGSVASGPVTAATTEASTTDPAGTAVFSGTTDDALLWQRLIYPNPLSAPDNQMMERWERTGYLGDVVGELINRNLGKDAAPERLIRDSLYPTSRLVYFMGGRWGLEPQTSVSERFSVLGDVVVRLLREGSFRYRYQFYDYTTIGTNLGQVQFSHHPVHDVSDRVRFDLANGTLTSLATGHSQPGATHVLVGGQGEGSQRRMIEVTTEDSEAQAAYYGHAGRVEVFVDQRDAAEDAALVTSGIETLSEAAGGYSASVVPSSDLSMNFLDDWDLGYIVGVIVDGKEFRAPVTAVTGVIDREGLRIGATLGSLYSTTPLEKVASEVQSVSRRVSNLERTIEVPSDFSEIVQTARLTKLKYLGSAVDLDDIKTTGTYINVANANATSGFNYPSGYAGMLEVTARADGGAAMVFQRYTDYGGSVRNVYYRGLYQSTWSPWTIMGAPDTGWVEVAYTAGNMAAVGTCKARRVGDLVSIAINADVSYSSPTTGNITNTDVLTLKDSRFIPVGSVPEQSLGSGATGRGIFPVIHNDGTVRIAAITPNATWTGSTAVTADSMTIRGTYLV